MTSALGYPPGACAEAASARPEGLSPLSAILEYGLAHSPSLTASRAEVELQRHTLSKARIDIWMPQVDATASLQKHTYDRPYSLGTTSASNNGTNPVYGAVVSFNLQKLVEPALAVAERSSQLSVIQEKVARRDLIRSIKKAYFAVREIGSELEATNKLIGLFARIDRILGKQRSLGVRNTIEREQFGSLKALLEVELSSRGIEQKTALVNLCSLSGLSNSAAKELISARGKESSLRFADRANFDPEIADALSEGAVIDILGRDYNLANLEYEKFSAVPLPSVFGRVTRESPTMLSSDGPQTTVEVGITLPLTALFTRKAEKSRLGSIAERNRALFERSLLEYRGATRMAIESMNWLKEQGKSLAVNEAQTEKLLDRSFLFYAQRRIDVPSTLDIFQKYNQARKMVLTNEMQIRSVDADLEYLLGDLPQ